MRGLSHRCARILRVRSIEHRAAAARETAAQRRVAELLGVTRRIGDLRAGLQAMPGRCDGQSLHAMIEMQQRLGRAEADLAGPTCIAEERFERALAARQVARGREDGAERLRDRAAAAEQVAAALREAANPHARFMKRRRG